MLWICHSTFLLYNTCCIFATGIVFYINRKVLIIFRFKQTPGHIAENSLVMSQLDKKKDIIKNFFCICPSTTPHCPLILPDRQLSYHFLKPLRMLPDILLRNSIIPVHLPEIRPISAHHPRRAGCGATETFICFFY